MKNQDIKNNDFRILDDEKDLLLDHDYDGIRELDNNLPPWWLYLMYGTVIFAVVYLVRTQVLGDMQQLDEYKTEMAQAKIDLDKYQKSSPDYVSEESVSLLTSAEDVSAGKALFQKNCVACHAPDGGGGVGPNLTDDKWILGGGIKKIFKTISNGGRAGKGMIAWKTAISAKDRQKLASFVISLNGTTPATPKAPQGDITWSK